MHADEGTRGKGTMEGRTGKAGQGSAEQSHAPEVLSPSQKMSFVARSVAK
jgi:hypothetical protein